MGGMAGAVPVPMMMPRLAFSTSPPTVTSPGAVIWPWPRNSRPPLPVNRSAATVSSQSSVASDLIRSATGAQSGATSDVPDMPGIRRPSASRSAARIIILDGTQPQYGHSPPTSRSSTAATSRPASASRSAASSAPGPIPMTITSTSCWATLNLPASDAHHGYGTVEINGARELLAGLCPVLQDTTENPMMHLRHAEDHAAAPLSEREAEHRLHGICFKTGPPGTLGVELEWLVCDRFDPALPVPHEQVARSLAALDTPGSLPGDGRLTFEPGGQVELSSAPAASLGDCVAAASRDLAALRQALRPAGLTLVGRGFDPCRPARRVLDLPRYAAMEEFFDRDGPWGRLMMGSTASVQVCVDAGRDGSPAAPGSGSAGGCCTRSARSWSRRSPTRRCGRGRRTGWKSTRQAVWARLDPSRTRAPAGAEPSPGRPGGDCDELDPRDEWTSYALDAEVMCVREERLAALDRAGRADLPGLAARCRRAPADL